MCRTLQMIAYHRQFFFKSGILPEAGTFVPKHVDVTSVKNHIRMFNTVPLVGEIN